MTNLHIGSRFDDFLAEEAMLEEVTAVAFTRVIAWQIEQLTEGGRLRKCAAPPSPRPSPELCMPWIPASRGWQRGEGEKRLFLST